VEKAIVKHTLPFHIYIGALLSESASSLYLGIRQVKPQVLHTARTLSYEP
jgi:hypothetical protein